MVIPQLATVFNVVESMERRVDELERPEVKHQYVLECLSKLYSYSVDLEPHCHWRELRRANNILLHGYKGLTVGTRMCDRQQLSAYAMQGTVDDLVRVYKKFIREVKRFEFMLADGSWKRAR